MPRYTASLALCVVVGLSLGALAAPPGYEVRTYTGPGLVNYDPTAPAASTENTLKEPWICPYCGYSTGGTWDTMGGGAPPWDSNSNGIPDEAEGPGGGPGECPDPWNTPGHPASVPLRPARPVERFMAYEWLGPLAAPLLTLVRGVPFKPGEIDPSVVGAGPGTANYLSRVRVGFAFDPNNSGTPDFSLTPTPTQVRFLLIPPGVARPTARYHSLRWAPDTTANPPAPAGTDEWGQALDPFDIRIGVHPWRAVDGDVYHVRVRLMDPSDSDLDVEVWSETNGLEFSSSSIDPTATNTWICASGAVRISVAPDTFLWNDDGDNSDVDPPQWWAFRFTICNNCRIMPNRGDDGSSAWSPDWLTTPNDPAFGSPLPPAPYTAPENYFVARPMPGGGPSRGQVLDTDPIGSGPGLSDATAVEFRLRPGETGTGMVAVLWRNDPANMWSYDEDTTPAGPAGTPEPGHPNGIQPVAARFFCSRVDTGNVVVDIPAGPPGGTTDVGTATGGGDLLITNRQVGEIARCPVHVPNVTGRSSGDPTNPYIDPWWVGGTATNGSVVGRGPGGDTPFDSSGTPIPHTGDPAAPTRTIGCGAVHIIDPTSQCWCGRTHNPAAPDTMYCNYCGTKLLATSTNPDDLERAAAQVDIEVPGAVASHAAVPDPLQTHAVYSLAAHSVRGTKYGVRAPGAAFGGAGASSTLRPVTSPVFASLPLFQFPSYAPGALGIFSNGAPQPYQGPVVAYRMADEEHRWYEDPVTGSHSPFGVMAVPVSPKIRVCDGNGRWDIFYRCPDCGNKHPNMALLTGAGGAPYFYTDEWTAASWAVDLQCSYGRIAGSPASDAASQECPGHQICTTCGVAWEAQGEGVSLGPTGELGMITLTVCPFDGTPLVSPGAYQHCFTPDDLTAEEFDPFVVQANVVRQSRLAADRPTVNLGRTERAWNAAGFPVEVTPIVRAGAHNEANYTVTGAALLTQGVTCASMAGLGSRTVTTSVPENLVLVRADAEPSPETRSSHRIARSLPITQERLFASIPNSFPAAGNWAGIFAPPEVGAAGGRAVHANMRGGTLAAVSLPEGLANGNYSGSLLAFVDTDANGALTFLDRSAGLTPTNSLTTPFDPTEDYPLEPVVPLNVRLRASEVPLPTNALADSDASPAPLFLDTDGDGLHDRLDLVWESNATGGPPAPDAPVNLRETFTNPAEMIQPGGVPSTAPGIARDYVWTGIVTPVTGDVAPSAVNGSPEVYIDPVARTRWLLWHRLAPTGAGIASTLWSARASGDLSDTFASAGTANYIFDTSLDKSEIRGFIDPTATPPNNHWSLWNSGKRGKEEIHYCAAYNPQDPNTVSDNILPVSNGVSPSAKSDWVNLGGTWIRKPPKSPFTYAKDPAPVMEMDPVTGEWMLHVFFSGFVPQESNADICYTKFHMRGLADPGANYGKIPHARIEGPWGGEELRADGPRQTFGSRHLDWVTSRRRPNEPGDADFMRAVAPVDPQFFIHLVLPTPSGLVREVYQITWAQEAAPGAPVPHRYNRAQGVYRLGALTFTRILGSTFSPTINPVEPRAGRPLEMLVDPAAGLVRFSAPLFNPTNPSDPSTFFNSGNFPGVHDVQLWANYTPYVYRICRTDANDDSPSAFFDYGDPTLASPPITPAERASLGRFVIFWRRSHGASDPPYFGRTAFMYKTFCSAVQVGHPPIGSLTSVNDVSGPTPMPIAPVGVDNAAGIIGLPESAGGVNLAGHRIEVVYDSVTAGPGQREYHVVPGWSEEKRVNIDTVYSEGPLLVKREWYAVPMTDNAGNAATQYIARYWLFWTSPRARYYYDPVAGTGTFYQSQDVYYTTVVPEYGTDVTETNLASS